MSKLLTYSGLLCLHSYGEADDILFISSESDPMAEVLDCHINRKQVTARYWITDCQCTKGQAGEDHMSRVMGNAKTDFGACYSELTGYLWTDEEVVIGGHDLIGELKQSVGKWLILEIEVHS